MSRALQTLEEAGVGASKTRRRLSVALVGADGAGKTTISGMLAREALPFPVRRIYMGVNLEASSLMLPSTRLLLAARRARGKSPDLLATELPYPSAGATSTASQHGQRSWHRTVKDGARLTVWMLEEWMRQLVAFGYSRRGYVVVFDRHFFADYYCVDGKPDTGGTFVRLHEQMLRHVYPKPNLVICLDAPAAVLFERKREWSLEWLERRRRQYLGLADAVPALVVVNANRPLDAVFADVVETIQAHLKAASA